MTYLQQSRPDFNRKIFKAPVTALTIPLAFPNAGAFMSICHAHNLSEPLPQQRPFGIRVKLRRNDPFRNLVGSDWAKEHWFATRAERDQALKEMSQKYIYFRPGDQPALDFETVDRA